MTCCRMGQLVSSGSMRLAKYGVISRRNRSLAEMPWISSGVRLIIEESSSRELRRWLSCQRQLFQSLSGTSAQIIGRDVALRGAAGQRLVPGGSSELTSILSLDSFASATILVDCVSYTTKKPE